jgi:hypothetical protein
MSSWIYASYNLKSGGKHNYFSAQLLTHDGITQVQVHISLFAKTKVPGNSMIF